MRLTIPTALSVQFPGQAHRFCELCGVHIHQHSSLARISKLSTSIISRLWPGSQCGSIVSLSLLCFHCCAIGYGCWFVAVNFSRHSVRVVTAAGCTSLHHPCIILLLVPSTVAHAPCETSLLGIAPWSISLLPLSIIFVHLAMFTALCLRIMFPIVLLVLAVMSSTVHQVLPPVLSNTQVSPDSILSQGACASGNRHDTVSAAKSVTATQALLCDLTCSSLHDLP